MSDAPDDEAVNADKPARKRPARRVTKKAANAAPAETVVNLSAPEPLVPESRPEPAPAPAAVESAPAPAPRPPRSFSEDSDGAPPEPVATFAEPPSSESQGSGKKRRRRKKNKHGQQQGGGGGGGSPQIFQTAPTPGYSAAISAQEYRESAPAPASTEAGGSSGQPQGGSHHHAPAMNAASRPKLDHDEVARKAWKIFLAEVSEEGLALIGDNDARELSRRSFRLAEVFVEESMRRQHR